MLVVLSGPGERGRVLSALVLRRQAAQRQAADRRGANPVRLHCAGDREHRTLQPQSQQLAAGPSGSAAPSRRHAPAVGGVCGVVIVVVVVAVVVVNITGCAVVAVLRAMAATAVRRHNISTPVISGRWRWHAIVVAVGAPVVACESVSSLHGERTDRSG